MKRLLLSTSVWYQGPVDVTTIVLQTVLCYACLQEQKAWQAIHYEQQHKRGRGLANGH